MKSVYRRLAMEIAAESNGGFMFDDGFFDSKQFKRYCAKVDDFVKGFMQDAISAPGSDISGADLSTLMRSFFKFWVSDYGKEIKEERDKDDKSAMPDWRNILMPLAYCDPYSFEDSDEVVKKGWMVMLYEHESGNLTEGYDVSLWDEFYRPAFKLACQWFLHDKYSKAVCDKLSNSNHDGTTDIDKTNFCIRGMLSSTGDIMAFIKILMNVIWTSVYSHVVWSQQERSDAVLDDHIWKSRAEDMKAENETLKNKIDELTHEIIPSYERKIREARAAGRSEAQSDLKSYSKNTENELRNEQKKRKQAEDDAAKAKARIKMLEEQIAIMEDAEADESEHGEKLDIELNAMSKIVFFASPAANSKIQNTFERISQKFPNCKFVHHFDDMNAGADCYVLLTKYLVHHSEYNLAKDFVRRQGLPYIHSGSQNPDRVYDDIVKKTRYYAN